MIQTMALFFSVTIFSIHREIAVSMSLFASCFPLPNKSKYFLHFTLLISLLFSLLLLVIRNIDICTGV